MKVLVVCEDPTYDQYIVKPVVQAIFAKMPRTATVTVLTDPHLRGIDDVLRELPQIVADHRMVDLFVVIVDRDCDRQRNTQRLANAIAGLPKTIACLGVEEIESWLLVLHRDALDDPWTTVRKDCDVKDQYALPLLDRLKLEGPGGGRMLAMRGLTSQWRSVLQLCPEVQELAQSIEMASQPESSS